MINIRHGVFETNSSSTHSICICTEEDFNKWKNEKKLWDYYSETLVDVDEVPEEERNTWHFRNYDFDEDCKEWYEEKFTTPSGDKMVVFGTYGYDY